MVELVGEWGEYPSGWVDKNPVGEDYDAKNEYVEIVHEAWCNDYPDFDVMLAKARAEYGKKDAQLVYYRLDVVDVRVLGVVTPIAVQYKVRQTIVVYARGLLVSILVAVAVLILAVAALVYVATWSYYVLVFHEAPPAPPTPFSDLSGLFMLVILIVVLLLLFKERGKET